MTWGGFKPFIPTDLRIDTSGLVLISIENNKIDKDGGGGSFSTNHSMRVGVISMSEIV